MCVWPGRRARYSDRRRPVSRVGPRKLRGPRTEAHAQGFFRRAARGQRERVNGGGLQAREVPAFRSVFQLGIETDTDRGALEVEGEPLERQREPEPPGLDVGLLQ